MKVDVGFIGTGGIATALAKGFCAGGGFDGKVYVFDIDEGRTRALREAYPDKVVVAASNQEVIERADVVFPTLLPRVLREVAPTLRFRKENRIIHIAAGIKIEESAPWFAPARGVARAVPLPFAARRIGPVVLYGGDALCEELLSLLGAVVKVDTERDLEILAAITGMMVSYYGVVGEMVGWAVGKGIDFQSALRYTTFMNEALSALMRSDCTEDVEAFLVENSTPQGMNELGLKHLRGKGAYAPWVEALEQIGKHYGL